MQVKNDLKIHQNTTFRVAGKMNGADGLPLGTEGWTVWSQIRTDVDTELVAKFAVTLDPSTQDFVFTLTAQETSRISPGYYLYDVLGRSPDGDIFLLAEGAVEVLATITELT